VSPSLTAALPPLTYNGGVLSGIQDPGGRTHAEGDGATTHNLTALTDADGTTRALQ
jgi:hypothetical protein